MEDLHDPTIAIVGAGPSGLFTAHYLAQRGYRNVVVLEKLGRVGGLVETVTVGGHSFDLGANYTTPAYREVLKVAKQVGAKSYTEKSMVAMAIPEDGAAVVPQSIFEASREWPDGRKIPILTLTWALIRFVWIRWRLSPVVDKPTFEGVDKFQDGALTRSVQQWLDDNNLKPLERIFELPVTLMGMGYLSETAVIYGLKFMTLRSFIPMVAKEMPLLGRIIPWPKRFADGYQRLLERISWAFDVRTNVDITNIERNDDRVRLTYTRLDQDLNEVVEDTDNHLDADYLILACPLSPEYNQLMKQLTPQEQSHFAMIQPNSYCMSTRNMTLPEDSVFGTGSPLAAVYPVPPPGSYTPYGVAKQWADSTFVQFYSRTPNDPGHFEQYKAAVEAEVSKVIGQMGGTEVPDDKVLNTFNRWDYFQHVSGDDIKAGWYNELEKMQGKHRTFYVGGATNLELVEAIANYSKNLVSNNFPVIPRSTFSWRGLVKWIVLILLVGLVVRCAFFPPPDQISDSFPMGEGQGQSVSQEFWDVFEDNKTSVLTPSNCEADPASDGDSLVCRLEYATAKQPQDPVLPLLAASVYLWRVQSNEHPALQQTDLERAIVLARQAMGNDNPFASGFMGSAQWLAGHRREGFVTLARATRDWPSFHGYIEGEQLSSGLEPDDPLYQEAIDSFDRMLNTCMFGDHAPTWLGMPEDTHMGNFMFNAAAIIFRLNGKRYCYNIPAAPYGVPGVFLERGDIFLKADKVDLAIIAYQNAQSSPGYASWPFKNRVASRLRNIERYRQAFLQDSGRIVSRNECTGTLGQSRYYCASCHAGSIVDPCTNE